MAIPIQYVTWHQVVNGGGGLITHLDIAGDGTKVCGTDVGGGYVFGSNWVQMFTQIKAPVSTFSGYRQHVGIAGIAWAKSNSNYGYAIYKNYVWRTTNKGLTWKQTGFSNATTDSGVAFFDANSTAWKRTHKIAVDPINHLVVYVSNPGGSAKFSVDGGFNWENVPDLPIGTGIGAGCFTFDESSGSTGGKTNTIWCAVSGEGVYRSTDAGVSFAVVDAAVGTNIANLGPAAISSDGVFYISWLNGSTNTISRYQSGSFSTVHTDGSNNLRVATHPVTAGVVCVMSSIGMAFRYSSNYGGSFTAYTKGNQTWASPDSLWQAANINAGFNCSIPVMKFDPNSPNDLWMCCGQGIWKATISAGVAPSWQTNVLGIEELVTNDLSHASGKSLLHGVWDEACFRRNTASLDTPVAAGILGASSNLQRGYSIARDPTNTSHVVFAGTNTVDCGYSLDDGATFTAFATIPSGYGSTYSCICINNGIIIWTNPNGGQGYPHRSDDWGATWVALDAIPDIPGTGNTGWLSTISVTKRTICADPVNPDKFYMCNYLSGQTPDIRGTWMSDDAGLTFEFQGVIHVAGTALTVTQMECVPGVEGHLFATCGHNTNDTHPQAGSLFSYSTNGGVSWTAITDVLEVQKFCFGKAMPGSANPTLFIAGFYDGDYGIFRSADLGTSWVQLWSSDYASWPIVNDVVTCMEGDKDVAGRCYVGFLGSGVAYCELAETGTRERWTLTTS